MVAHLHKDEEGSKMRQVNQLVTKLLRGVPQAAKAKALDPIRSEERRRRRNK